MNTLKDLRLKSKKEVQEYLGKKSDEELVELFAHIIEDKPLLYESAIEFIINRLYSDNKVFVNLLCSLIEKTASDLAFKNIINLIRKVALNNPKTTLAIAKKMIDLRVGDGMCSGIIISPLLGDNAVDNEIFSYLKSEDLFLQRHSLFAIYYAITTGTAENNLVNLIKNLIKVVKNISQENTDILIPCLMSALFVDKGLVLPVLKKEIEQRGYTAALIYACRALYRKDFPISLLKKAVQIIESEAPENEIIDEALARIYEEDKDFVIERLRKRVKECNRARIAGDILVSTIQKTDYFPVIQMLEEEIDNGNDIMIYFGENILEVFFPSKQEWLKWCKKWKDDEQKRVVILRSLEKILSEFLSKFTKDQQSSLQDNDIALINEAIDLVKELAEKNGLDYKEETKDINFGKDSREGAKYREEAIKALRIINKLLYPPAKIDINVLKENLKNYPYLSKAIGKDLVKIAKSGRLHPLVFIYSEMMDENKIVELHKKLESEKDENKKLQIASQLDSLLRLKREQKYWEQVFRTLCESKIPKSKLESKFRDLVKDLNNVKSILAELEVIARLVPYFNVEIEPDIPELRPKKFDAKIEFNGQEALIEIRFVEEKTEFKVARGVVISSTPGEKVKKVLLDKLFKGQLMEGKVDPKMPVILVLCLDTGLDYLDAENAIYGQLQFQFKIRKDTGQIVESGMIRESNSFYEIKGTDIVSAIAVYKRDYTRKDPLVGKLYLPPPSVVPRNPLSREFRVRLRDALFRAFNEFDG